MGRVLNRGFDRNFQRRDDGRQKTNWFSIKEVRLIDENGDMVAGFVTDILGNTYYLDETPGPNLGKMVKGVLKQELQKGKKARRNSMYMSDDDLLHAIKNTRRSIGERAGFFQALKDRHKK